MAKFYVIVSHPRSGTNALIDFIKQSFPKVYDLKDFFRPMNENDLRWFHPDELKERFNFNTSIETHDEHIEDPMFTLDHLSHFSDPDQNFTLKIFPGHMPTNTINEIINRTDVKVIHINRDVVDTEISLQKAKLRDPGDNSGYSYIDNTYFKIDLDFDVMEENVKKLRQYYSEIDTSKGIILEYDDIADWIERRDPEELGELINLRPFEEKQKKIKRWKQDLKPHAFYKINNYEDLRIRMRKDRDFRNLLKDFFSTNSVQKFEQKFDNLAELRLSLDKPKKDGYFKVGVSQTISMASGYNWVDDKGWTESSPLTYRGTNASLFSRNALNLCAGYNPTTGEMSDPGSIQGRRTIEMDSADRIYMQVGADNAYYEDNPKADLELSADGVKVNGYKVITEKELEEWKQSILNELKGK